MKSTPTFIKSILVSLSAILIQNSEGRNLRSLLFETEESYYESLIYERPEDEPLYCPTKRYTPWLNQQGLYRRTVLRQSLGYNANMWNLEPLAWWNPLEEYAWTSSQVVGVHADLNAMGYDEDSWDCCISHYYEYTWEDFVNWNYTEQKQAHEALGWTEESFGSTNHTLYPESEGQTWEQLSGYQQFMAASKLCYTSETWNEELALYDWPEGFKFPDAW